MLHGVKQKMRGITFEGKPCSPTGSPLSVYSDKKVKIGQIASGVYSPRIKKNIGLSMILKDHWDIGKNVLVETLDGDRHEFSGIGVSSSALPFHTLAEVLGDSVRSSRVERSGVQLPSLDAVVGGIEFVSGG